MVEASPDPWSQRGPDRTKLTLQLRNTTLEAFPCRTAAQARALPKPKPQVQGLPVPARYRELPKSASRLSIDTDRDSVISDMPDRSRRRRRFSSLFKGLRIRSKPGDTSPTLSIRSSMSTTSWAGSMQRRMEVSLDRAKRPPSLVSGAKFVPQLQSPLPTLENFWDKLRDEKQ